MVYTVQEAAARLKISPATVYALINSGKLACHRIGVGRGVIRISEANIATYLEACHMQAAAQGAPRLPRPRLKHLKL